MSIDPLTHADLCKEMRTALTTRDLSTVKALADQLDWARVNADLETASAPTLVMRRAILPVLISSYSQNNNDAHHEPGLTELDDFLIPALNVWLDRGYNPLSDPTLREVLSAGHALYGDRPGVMEHLLAEATRRNLKTPKGVSAIGVACSQTCEPRLVAACLKAGGNPSDHDAEGRPLLLSTIGRLHAIGTMADADSISDQSLYVGIARILIEHGADLNAQAPSSAQSSQETVLDHALKWMKRSDVLARKDPAALQLYQELNAAADNVVLTSAVHTAGQPAERTALKM